MVNAFLLLAFFLPVLYFITRILYDKTSREKSEGQAAKPNRLTLFLYAILVSALAVSVMLSITRNHLIE